MVALGKYFALPPSNVVRTVDTIADLRTAYLNVLETVLVRGYFAPDDAGGGEFYAVTGGSYTDNGGTVITPNAGTDTSAWIRLGAATNGAIAGPISVLCFGADASGVSDSRAAIQGAIDVVRLAGGGTVVIPDGNFLIQSTPSLDSVDNGIWVPYSADDLNLGGTPRRVQLACTNATTLLAGSDNMVVIRWSDSLGSITGLPTISNNGHTGVWGLGLIPDDMTQLTTCVFQTFNTLNFITRGTDEGLVMMAGPNVAGRDSGCWYNTITHYHFGGKRGRWLKPATTPATVSTTRNTFYGRVGNLSSVGMEIQSGANNVDYTNYEGILTNDPIAPAGIATAVVIYTDTGVPGSDNADNRFFGYIEACTVWMVNGSNSTQWFCPILDETKVVFSGVYAGINCTAPVIQLSRLATGSFKGKLKADLVDSIGNITAGNEYILYNYSLSRQNSLMKSTVVSNTYNGLWLANNESPGGVQTDPALTSWAMSLGGFDGASYGTNRWSILYRPAGGSYSPILTLRGTGGLILPSLAGDPTGATDGEIYYNTTSGTLRYYKAGVWTPI